MKHNVAIVWAASLVAVPALAQQPTEADKPKPEVVETNDKGQATRVRIGETLYYVCVGERQDSCINPRDAGLDFGNRELDYWPGKPASEIEGPIPTREEVLEQAVKDAPAEPTMEDSPAAN